MTGKHSQKLNEVRPEKLDVHFSPEMKRHFARLEAAVCDSEHFSPEMLWILQDLAGGKTSSVRSTMLGVAAVIHETGKHVRTTNDEKTDELLAAIVEGLTIQPDGPEPITLVKSPAKRQGRGG
jgi:hypothetical protein